MATSGAANTGIDNANVYGIFRFDFPPSVEDIIQENGRAGRCGGSSYETDKYTVYISLESILAVLWRILVLEETTPEFKKVLLNNLHIAMGAIVLPTGCIKLLFVHKASNPFTSHEHPFPSPCGVCSYYRDDYQLIFPTVSQVGLMRLLMDIFMGESRIQGSYSINNAITKAVFDYKYCNQLVFRVNSQNKPQPILAKKSLMMLIVSSILDYNIKKKVVVNDGNNTTNYEATEDYLAFTCDMQGLSTNRLAINDYRYWQRIPPN